MKETKLLDTTGYILGILTVMFSFGLLFQASSKFSWSLVAAFFAGAMVFIGYVTIRWMYLAMNKE